MRHKNVLISDFVHPTLLTSLQSIGYELTYAPAMKREEMETVLEAYVGVVINTKCPVNREAMASAKKLKWIARLGSGLDIIDLGAASEFGIKVFSAPEGNAQAVAEHAMAMLLALSNKLISSDATTREGSWLREQHRGWEIEDKTIGIIGYGHNGSAFARLWQGWKVRLLVYDKYLTGFGTDQIEETDLGTLQRESDVISLHIPLTPETSNMVDVSFLSSCKSGSVLINTSRGKNVDLGAVCDALKNGQLKGACLDVLPFEPPSNGPADFQHHFQDLCSFENVILSPHVAGWTVESKEKIAKVLSDKIKSFTTLSP